MLQKFGISALEKFVYLGILLLLGIVAFMFYFYPGQLWQAVQEDAIIEDLTIFFLIACLFICIGRAGKLACQKHYKGVFTFSLLSLGMIFIVGEELSWGQRIFDINSNDFFLDNNTQSETNFHNLKIGNVRLNKLIFTQLGAVAMAVYFLLSRFLCKKVKWIGRLRSQFLFPLPKVHHAIFFYFAFLAVYAFHYKRNSEVFELILPCIFMLVILNPYQPQGEKP